MKAIRKTKPELTVFVITTGESTYEKCIAALRNQTTQDFVLETIANVSPMNRAFQRMLDLCKTRYYIQVDADMILHPFAIETMLTRFKEAEFVSAFTSKAMTRAKTAMLFFPLFDVHLEHQIIGVKIYDHHIFKNYPYEADFSCEVTQIDRLQAAGYHISYQDPIVGLHGTEWTAHQIYERYKRLFQKRAIYGSENHNYAWLNPLPKKFFDRYLQNRNPIDLWAYKGALAGIVMTSNASDGEQDASRRDLPFAQLLETKVDDRLHRQDALLHPVKPSLGQYLYGSTELAGTTDAEALPRRRICLVTCEFPGFGPHGGIATAFKLLALELAKAGHSVFVLFVTSSAGSDYKDAQQDYFALGVTVEVLSVPHSHHNSWTLTTSAAVKYWLWDRSFDYVHFPEYRGLAFYTLLAKHQGYRFDNTIFCVQAHGPATQLIHYNGDWDVDVTEQLIAEHCERQSVQLADALISPSRFLADWFISEGFRLPEQTYLVKNVPPSHVSSERTSAVAGINEIVFFGKQIELKGVVLFCDALDQLDLGPDIRVTFLGRSARVNYQDSLGYIAQRALNWRCAVSFELDVTPQTAMSYCAAPSRLVVIPSLIENSPYVVMECLAAQCRFIASDVGGLGELLDPECHPAVLFKPNKFDLADKIGRYLNGATYAATASYNYDNIVSEWLRLHRVLRNAKKVGASKTRPKCTVCIPHLNRPMWLKNCLSSVLFQDGVELEIVVVDDGSSSEHRELLDIVQRSFSAENVKWVFQPNSGLGAARNAAAAQASTDVLVFIDDDDILLPGGLALMLDTLVHCTADIVIGAYKAGKLDQSGKLTFSKSQAMPDFLGVGACEKLAMRRNVFGPAVCCIKRSSFEELGGYPENHQTPYEDWAFYSRAMLRGAHIEHVSEPVFVYCDHPAQMTKTMNMFRGTEQVLNVFRTHGMISGPSDFAARALMQETCHASNRAAWRRVDASPHNEHIKKINAGSILPDERLTRVAELLRSNGKTVQINAGNRLCTGPSQTLARSSVLDDATSAALIAVARELMTADSKRAISFVDDRIKKVRFQSENWRTLMLIRARCHINGANFAQALIDVFDSGVDNSNIDAVAGLAVCYACLRNDEKHIDYDNQLQGLEEQSYLLAHPDVQSAIRSGVISAAKDHFLLFGKLEGRSWPVSTIFGDLIMSFRAARLKIQRTLESVND